jgi:hypothetical protein
MKINLKFLFLLFGLIVIVLSEKENKKPQVTKITITTTEDEVEAEEKEKEKEKEKEIISQKNITKNDNKTKNDTKKEKAVVVPVQKRDNAKSEIEKMIQEAKKNSKENTTEKVLTLTVPYQDNEDYILSPMGFGTPVNFIPLQVETTSYKTWVSSILNEDNPSIFSYNLKESKTGKEAGDWDTVVDEEGTINGNTIYDIAYIGKYKIPKFKFIEAVEFEEDFRDYKNGKLGLGNCQYAEDKEFCLIDRLKENGSIDRKLFSMRELSDTHGELVIGDIAATSKEKDYPLLNLLNDDMYSDIENEEFKMGWLTKGTHILFRNNTENIKNIFDNNIYLKDGIISFDSSCHYIEGPYSYINDFEDQLFDIYYDNVCRKVNRDGTYMFLCDKERYEQVKDKNKDLSLIMVIGGYGFEIPMNFLFEKTNEDDYEFFVHFKDFEQNIWNLGHPFFHYYTIIFDQDNQEVGIDGEMIYSLQDEIEAALKKKKSGGWFKVFLWILFGLLLLIGLFLLARKIGINQKLNAGVSPSLVDNEESNDLSFEPGENINH